MEQLPIKENAVFEKRLQKLQIIFAEARDKVMCELKDEPRNAGIFVPVVIRCTQAVKCHPELHGYETDDLIVDLVDNVMSAFNTTPEAKAVCYPTILGIVNAISAANKQYLSLVSKAEREAQTATNNKKKKKRGVRNEPAADVTVTPVVDMAALITEVYHTASNGFRQRKLNTGTIISIGSQLMQIVEQYPRLSGTQKKEVVIAVIHKIINASDLSVQEKLDLSFLVDTVLSLTINFIVKAYNGEIPFINNMVAKVNKCFGGCCGGEAKE